ncbi:protein DGCR14 [Zootermopsis nevadensis]|uniref:DGCR14-like protein n=1 Tax=Zootermopsis nevadensis TaxID=136037 RepID=A0A067QM37_ZOONE|nr:protein DGCR14 [Zootermopsis nevadensis]KDR09235.1 DGCR14-like protein [Zootermopsis nevadensis]
MPQDIINPGDKGLVVEEQMAKLQIFKEPVPPVRLKIKTKKVLDEDSYLREMGRIIQRDFFPDLEKLRAQNAYLEAVERNDVEKLREIYAKYSSGKRPPTERYASPATFETPLDARREDDHPDAEDEPDKSQLEGKDGTFTEQDKSSQDFDKQEAKTTLDVYLNSHTSEDNQSFQEIMRAAELRHRHKFGWLYKAEEDSKEELKEMMRLPSIEEQASNEKRPLMVDTWKYRNKNYIMYVPDGVPLTPEEEVELARRRQVIVHSNTSLTSNPFDEQQNKETIHQLAQSQAQSLEGKIGVDGKELIHTETPKVNGFSFVKTPSPAPGVGESPLMTWGEIEGTPFRLDGGDTPVRTTLQGPSFRIPEPPKREKLALALAEKAGERHRDRKMKAIEAARKQLATPSPHPRSGTTSLDRLNSMSPAARRLASTQLRRRIGSDLALLASYSPSPRHSTRNGHPSPHFANTPTPGKNSSGRIKRVATPNLNITDNLLNLPKRPRAADFF